MKRMMNRRAHLQRRLQIIAMGRVTALAGVLLFVMTLLPEAIAAGVSGDSMFISPMVQQVTEDGFTLTWSTSDASTKPCIVNLREDEPQESQSEWTASYATNPKEGRFEIEIRELEPGRTYLYEVLAPERDTEGKMLFSGKVKTAPEPGESFRFIAFGDSGDGSEKQYTLARKMPSYEPDVIIQTGDLVNPDGLPEDYPANFFTPYADWIRNTPLYPACGNHDYYGDQGQTMRNVFVLPQNGPDGLPPELNYYFDYGDVRFVCIDTNMPFETMRKHTVAWLDEVLAGAGDRWIVVYYHHPVFTHGKYQFSGKIRTLLVPLFDRYGVDLALNGHNHMYERTVPMRSEKPAPDGNGTVYITTGAGGCPLYKIRENPPGYLKVQNNTMHSFTVVDVSPDTLEIRQVGIDGNEMDAFSIRRGES